ncbi:uncharacterized protein [Anabrus simplex]|uniref:uncharacterized protein n=1 Tax=Anabrus simplex TaxID=316456 RepID=UPI0035A27CD5
MKSGESSRESKSVNANGKVVSSEIIHVVDKGMSMVVSVGTEKIRDWRFDSGASHHMCPIEEMFIDMSTNVTGNVEIGDTNVAYSEQDTSILEIGITNFVVNDTSASELQPSTNDDNSSLAASYPFDVYEGQEFMVKLTNKHLDEMTACIIKNQRSKIEAQLLPLNKNSSIHGVFYWGGGWDSRECGVRITNVNGTSTWILSAVKNNETIYKETIVLRSKPVPKSEEYYERVWVGKNSSLTLTSALPEVYCSVKHPSGDKEVTIYGKNCIYNISSVSGYDEGLWTASVGISHLIRELEFKTDVEVKGGRVVAGWRNSSTSYPGAVDLYCALVDQPPDKSPSATYCHFIRPNDNVGFLMNEGVGNGKYSYYGNGLDEYECGVTIEKPEQEDIGVWQCILGFESSYNASLIHFYPSWMQSLRGVRKELTSTQQVINVINGSDISLMCSASEALQYCFMVAPDGSQYPGDRKLLGIGTCQVVVKSVNEKHSGHWSCLMGPDGGGKELSEKISVTVTTTKMISVYKTVNASVGGHAILRCQSIPDGSFSESAVDYSTLVRSSLSYCRFGHPSGISVTLNDNSSSPVEQRFRYYGKGLQDGECGILIDPVSIQDGGEWTCAGVAGIYDTESRATITLDITDSTEIFPGSALVEPNEEVILQMKGRRDRKHYNPGRCTKTLDSVSSLDLGVWTCYIGLPTTTHELVETIELTARASSLSANVKTTSRSVEMSCTVDYPLKYCRFVDPRGASIIVREGFMNERLSYSGQGLLKGHCGLSISPVNEQDYGVWMCFAGVNRQGFVEHQVNYISLSKEEDYLRWNICRGGLTLSEVMDILEADDELGHQTEDIFIEPPDGNVDTDEDSANEDEGGMVHNLTGHQMRAAAEIRLANDEHFDLYQGKNSCGDSGYDRLFDKAASPLVLIQDELPTILSRSALAATVTRKEVIAVERSELTLECEYSTSLAYCWLLHPNGTQLVPVPASNTELQMGICRLTLPEVHLEDAGRWACHMGTLGSYGQEIEVHIDVEIKSSPLYAARTNIVTEDRKSTTAMCYTVPGGAKLDYCRFLRPDGKGFSLNQDMTGAAMGRYRYYGEGLNKGHCGVIIDQVASEDLGRWYCAAVLHGTSEEASTSFMVQFQETKSDDSLVWIIPTGVGAVVLVAVGIVIVYNMRWREQTRLSLASITPVGPRVSDTSSESSIFSREEEIKVPSELVDYRC